MQRTTIMLPRKLKTRAARRAKKSGLSMGEFIRQAIEKSLAERGEAREGTLFDLQVYTGKCPNDVSSNSDEYLYGEER